MLKIKPITLNGKYVILRYPTIEDKKGLSIAAKDGEIWKSPFSRFPHHKEIPNYLKDMLDLSKKA